jgi:hypothetical protein
MYRDRVTMAGLNDAGGGVESRRIATGTTV